MVGVHHLRILRDIASQLIVNLLCTIIVHHAEKLIQTFHVKFSP